MLPTTVGLLGIIVTFFLIHGVFASSDGTEPLDTSDQPPEVNCDAHGFRYPDSIPFRTDHDCVFAPKRISVTLSGKQFFEGLTTGMTVSDVLETLGIVLNDEISVIPPLETNVCDTMEIIIDEVVRTRKVELESIPYASISILDDTRELDTTTVVQTGAQGQRKVIYEYTYVNGIYAGRQPVHEEILAQPQDEITAIGTKKVYRTVMIGEDTISYWKVMRVFATSYDSNCAGCNNITATGAVLQRGVCAVDPTVIPMKSHFYVPGYGHCQALDVGGAIKGNKIDLGFEDLAAVQGAWSARYIDIYLTD
ncbi:MAG: G5 domain-containing protein [Candidatus Dojkabacteria bacterium]|nr:G5 domain-containing protein [Candidatus Dojkabacteria bacterium]